MYSRGVYCYMVYSTVQERCILLYGVQYCTVEVYIAVWCRVLYRRGVVVVWCRVLYSGGVYCCMLSSTVLYGPPAGPPSPLHLDYGRLPTENPRGRVLVSLFLQP